MKKYIGIMIHIFMIIMNILFKTPVHYYTISIKQETDLLKLKQPYKILEVMRITLNEILYILECNIKLDRQTRPQKVLSHKLNQ